MVTPEGIRGKEYKEEEEGEEEDREVIGEHTKERGKIRRFLLRRGKRKRVVVSRMSAQGTARIGILYRKRGYIQSIRVPEGEAVAHTVAELTSVDAVEDWMKGDRKEKGDRKDPSYLDYFYRCLDEVVEFYYLYEEGVGWKCGCTMRDLPHRGRLVALEDWLRWRAIEV